MAKRQYGEGSIYRRNNGGLWIGAVTVPTVGQPRQRKQVAGKLFCQMLLKFTELQRTIPQRQPVRSRQEMMAEARALGTHTAAEWYAKLAAQKDICYYCGEIGYRELPSGRMFPDLTQDHMTPVCRGGSDAIDNLVGACEPCNRRKGRMTADEYMQVLRRG